MIIAGYDRRSKKLFDNQLIGDAKTRLVIPSMNIDTGEVLVGCK